MERCRSSVGHNAIFVDRLSPSVAAKRHIVSDDCGVISALIDTPSGGFPDIRILEGSLWWARASILCGHTSIAMTIT